MWLEHETCGVAVVWGEVPFRACLAKTAKQELTRDEVILRSCLRGSKCDLSFSSLSGAIWVVVWAAKVFSLSQRWGACCLQLEIAPPFPNLYGTVNTWAKWIKWGRKGKSLVFPGVVGCAFRPFMSSVKPCLLGGVKLAPAAKPMLARQAGGGNVKGCDADWLVRSDVYCSSFISFS